MWEDIHFLEACGDSLNPKLVNESKENIRERVPRSGACFVKSDPFTAIHNGPGIHLKGHDQIRKVLRQPRYAVGGTIQEASEPSKIFSRASRIFEDPGQGVRVTQGQASTQLLYDSIIGRGNVNIENTPRSMVHF